MSKRRKARSTWRKTINKRVGALSRRHKLRSIEKLEDRIALSADPIYATEVSHQTIFDRMLDQAFTHASNLSNYTASQLESAQQWVVKTDGSINAANFAAQTGLLLADSSNALSNTYYALAGNLSSSAITNLLSNNSSVEYFYPSVTRNFETQSLTNDPLVDLQWHLRNTGQELSLPNEVNQYAAWGDDLRVEEAWKIATGEGVNIVVTDAGVEYLHPDLVNNFDTSLSFNFNQQFQSPYYDPEADFHGTAVAGIIAAEGNNGIGVTGVAHDATLSDFRFLGTDLLNNTIDEDDYYQLFTLHNDVIDVYNNSWGEASPGRTVVPFFPGIAQGVIDAAFLGRGGLGVIHVKSSGNDALDRDTAANSRLTNTPYVVTVAGFGPDGTSVNYAAGGPSVFVTAPTGQNPPTSGIVTTDLAGENGYNNSDDGLNHDGDWLDDLDYTSQFNGTSSSAPMVSGVVALMIEAARDNGTELSLRDVQHILARSSYQVDREDYGGINGEDFDGIDLGGWQTNARPLFYDPLDEGGIPVGAFNPNYLGSDAIVNPVTNQRSAEINLASGVPQTNDRQFALATNSAGFAVHDGFRLGYGHGAVDAKLAVELASTWRSVGTQQDVQILSASFGGVGVAAAELVDNITIPGGIDGQPGFAEYFDLWINGPPDGGLPDPLPENTRGQQSLSFAIPANYSVEWVEVTMQFSMPAADTEQLRFTLVSPDGVHSELTNWSRPSSNSPLAADGNVNFTFSTNRHWGERTEGVGFIDPLTGDRIEPNAVQDANGVTTAGLWELVIENWSGSATSLAGTLDFHATPTPSINYLGTQLGGRIQGSIGLDINQDDQFNFTGVVAEEQEVMGIWPQSPIEIAVASSLDTEYEPNVAGVKVYLDLNEDGDHNPELDEPWTYTTADGNYFFDMVWNINPDDTAANYDYQVRFELPDGYTVVGDDMHEFRIGVQDDQSIAAYHIDGNFILQPAPITFEGNVFADYDLDEIPDANEPMAGQFRVFVDLNENGVLDFIDFNGNNEFDNGIDEALEPMEITDANGFYSVEVSTDYNVPTDLFGNPLFFNDFFVGPDYYSLMVDSVEGWTPTGDKTAEGFAGTFFGEPSPSLAFKRLYVEPGETLTELHFGHASLEGAVSGIVFHDLDGDGVQDPGEMPVNGFQVYLDLDGDGTMGLGEPRVTTNEQGFSFADLDYDIYDIRIIPLAGWEFTNQNGDLLSVEVIPGILVDDLSFGVRSLEGTDYGDLPASYGEASHSIVPGYFLGSGVDGEPGTPTDPNATGDDINGTNDDDGVSVGDIVSGELVPLAVTASHSFLFFQGWIDFNNNGSFDTGEQLELRDAAGNLLGTEVMLNAGINNLSFLAPQGIIFSNLAGRYRYGVSGDVTGPTGAATGGEVEDYIHGATPNPASFEPVAGDYDGSLVVDADDYALWKQTFGSTTDLRADGNGDGVVNLADLTVWRDNQGAEAQPIQALVSPLTGGGESALAAPLTSTSNEQSIVPNIITTSDGDLAAYSTGTSANSGTPVAAEPSNAAGESSTPLAVDAAFAASEDDETSSIESIVTESSTDEESALVLALEEEFGFEL